MLRARRFSRSKMVQCDRDCSFLITDAGVVDWDQHWEKILQLLYYWSHFYKTIMMMMMVLVSKQHEVTSKYKMKTTPLFSLICQSGEDIIIQKCRASSSGNNFWGLPAVIFLKHFVFLSTWLVLDLVWPWSLRCWSGSWSLHIVSMRTTFVPSKMVIHQCIRKLQCSTTGRTDRQTGGWSAFL